MKNRITTLFVLGVLLFGLVLPGQAQDEEDLKVSFEEIQKKCKDRPAADRVRVAVTRFSMATGYRSTYKASQELGANMSTMLTNALYEVDCFTVLEMLANNEDLTQELDFGETKYANQNAVGAMGKQEGAQLVVTGEITEYTEQNRTTGISIINVGSQTVKLGFVLKLVNPETRRLVWSKSINVEGKANKSTRVGLRWFRLGESTNDNPALSNALEKGIFKAVELMMENLDNLDLPEIANPNQNQTTITIANTNYGQVRALEGTIGGVAGVSGVSKGLDGTIGTLIVAHQGSTEDLMDALYNTLSSRYAIEGVSSGRIDLKAK